MNAVQLAGAAVYLTCSTEGGSYVVVLYFALLYFVDVISLLSSDSAKGSVARTRSYVACLEQNNLLFNGSQHVETAVCQRMPC